MKIIIYKATCMVNGKAYIGQTKQSIKTRREQHESDARTGKMGCRLFHRALKKHGVHTIRWEKIGSADSIATANDIEIKKIDAHGTLHPHGYNLTKGGNSGAMPCAIVCKKISTTLRGRKLSAEHRANIRANAPRGANHPLYGHSPTVATRTKMSIAHRARWQDEEYRAKMSVALRGKKHTAEARAKMSVAQKGKVVSVETRVRIGNAHRGKIVSADTRAKIGAKSRGRKHSPETRARMSAAIRVALSKDDVRAKMSAVQRGENNTFYGRTHTAETRRLISRGLLGKMRGEKNPFYGRKHSPETRAHISAAARARYARMHEAKRMQCAAGIQGALI